LASIAGKTAALMATACRIGAITAGIDRTQVEAFTSYGLDLGMVFQIVDDILDVVATDQELGKPAGNDLMEGVYTLPVIRALASAEADELRALLTGPLDRPAVDKARALIRSNGAVGSARAVARTFAAKASDGLLALGDGAVLQALRSLPNHLEESVPAQ
jgi:geranylgeranyl pyrophosphate synthase